MYSAFAQIVLSPEPDLAIMRLLFSPLILRNFVIEGVACQPPSSFWSKTDIASLKQNLCLAPDQKIVRTKKVANDQKINLAS